MAYISNRATVTHLDKTVDENILFRHPPVPNNILPTMVSEKPPCQSQSPLTQGKLFKIVKIYTKYRFS